MDWVWINRLYLIASAYPAHPSGERSSSNIPSSATTPRWACSTCPTPCNVVTTAGSFRFPTISLVCAWHDLFWGFLSLAGKIQQPAVLTRTQGWLLFRLAKQYTCCDTSHLTSNTLRLCFRFVSPPFPPHLRAMPKHATSGEHRTVRRV